MIERIEGLPDDVLALQARGEVTAEDYQSVLVPALEDLLRHHRRVRLLYVLGDGFDGYTGGAAWEDAKVGMRHLTAFERVAVVTDEGWVTTMVKAFGFAMPGEVRVFGTGELDEARTWISEPLAAGAATFDLDETDGVLVVRPHGELEAGDFDRLTATVDPFTDAQGELRGLMIVTEEFPGWDDFAAFTAHMRFVKDHQKKIRRVALVTDARVFGFLPRIGRHLLAADIRSFPMSEEAMARRWAAGA